MAGLDGGGCGKAIGCAHGWGAESIIQLSTMFPPLLPVETVDIPLPTFNGILALLRNALTISDALGKF
jgi:hypothetical protein